MAQPTHLSKAKHRSERSHLRMACRVPNAVGTAWLKMTRRALSKVNMRLRKDSV